MLSQLSSFWTCHGVGWIVVVSIYASQETHFVGASSSACASVRVGSPSEEPAFIGCGGRACPGSISGQGTLKNLMAVEEGRSYHPAAMKTYQQAGRSPSLQAWWQDAMRRRKLAQSFAYTHEWRRKEEMKLVLVRWSLG